MERVFFYIFAIIIIIFAVKSVTSKKILRAIMFLLIALLGIAALYFMLDYAFLGAVQMAVYAGGIIILFIFSVLLIHQVEGEIEEASSKRKWGIALVSLLGLAITLTTIYSYDFRTSSETAVPTSVENIGKGLLNYGENGFILPFEVISILLLAAMIGAIIIAKGRKNI